MNNKIFIGGLNYNTTESVLRSELEIFGKVVTLRVITDRETGKSKGYAFATYEDCSCAEKAIEALNNTMFDDRRIGVKPSIEK